MNQRNDRTGPQFNPAAWQVCASHEHGFAFQYPLGWVNVPDIPSIVYHPAEAHSFQSMAGSKPRQVFSPALTLMLLPRGKTERMTPEQTFADFRNLLPRFFPGFTQRGEQTISLSTGHVCREIEFDFLKDGRPFRAVLTHTVLPERIFLFDGSGLQGDFSTYEPLLRHALRSLRLGPAALEIKAVQSETSAPTSEDRGGGGGEIDSQPLERERARQEHERAVNLLDRGEFRAALEVFERVLRAVKDDPHPMIFLNIAVCHAELGEFSRALAVLEDALRRWPENSRLRSNYEAISQAARESAAAAPARQDSPTAQRIERLNEQAVRLFQRAEFEEALAAAAEAVSMAEKAFPSQEPHARSLNSLGAIHYQRGDFARAEPLLRQALAIARALGRTNPEHLRALGNLAVLCQRIGQLGEAEAIYREVLSIRRESGDERNPAYGKNLNNLGKLLEGQGKLDEAEPLLTEAREIALECEGAESAAYAVATISLAELLQARGQTAAAERLFQESLERMERIGEGRNPAFAACLTGLGEVHRLRGDYQQAEQFLRRADQALRAIYGEEHPTLSANLGRLGNVLQESGDYRGAEEILGRVMEATRRRFGEASAEFATCLTNLGMLRQRIGDLAAAESYLRRALAIRRQVLGTEHPDAARGLCNLARVLDARGDDAAESLYREALELFRSTLGPHDSNTANCLNDLGALRMRQGRFREAAEIHQQACDAWKQTLGENHPLVAMALNNVANALDALGEFARAEAIYRQAVEQIGTRLGEQHPLYAGALRNLAGSCAAAERWQEAFALASRAMAIDQQLIGNVFGFGSESQRMAFLHTLQDDLFTFVSMALLVREQVAVAIGAAFEAVLRRKALAAEAYAVQREAVLKGRHPQLRTQLEELARLRMKIAQQLLAAPEPSELESRRQALAEDQSRLERLQGELAWQIPEMDLNLRLAAVEASTVAGKLPAGSALVEFLRCDIHNFSAVPARGESRWLPARYLAFVLVGKTQRVTLLDLGEAEGIDLLIAAHRESLLRETEQRAGRNIAARRGGPASATTENSPGEVLRAAIFDRLLPALEGADTLLVAPDGELAKLPFESLPLEQGRWLLDSHEIGYLSCGRDLLRFDFASGPTGAPLLVADPDFNLTSASSGPAGLAGSTSGTRHARELREGAYHFAPLPATGVEGERIAGLLEAAKLLRGPTALKQSLRAECRSPRILHLATHGFFLPARPDVKPAPGDSSTGRLSGNLENPLLRSGLALAGANTWLAGGSIPAEAEDGLLTADDVAGLDLLTTELVVLSACETGLGEIHNGEGVFGLRRAFVLAGAATLVMSLWKVDDLATSVLMERFYQTLMQRRLSPASALRDAQRYLRELNLGELRNRWLAPEMIRRLAAGDPQAEAGLAALAGRSDTERPFAEPFYWAAFICQGDGSRFVRA